MLYPAKTQYGSPRVSDLSKLMMSAFISKCHKNAIKQIFDKNVMSLGFKYHQESSDRHMDQESKYCANYWQLNAMWRQQNKFLLFTPISIENSHIWSIVMTFGYLKTDSTKLTNYRREIQKVIEVFTFSPWCNIIGGLCQNWPFSNSILKLRSKLISHQRASNKTVKSLNRCFQS